MSLAALWEWQFPPLPLGLQVRASTLLTAAIVFALVLLRTRSPGRSLIAVAAWIAAYQILFDLTQVLVGQHEPKQLVAGIGLLGWVILAFVLGNRPSLPWLAAFGLAWVVWIAFGFHSNAHNQPPYSALDEMFNVVTKTALGLAYAFEYRSLHARNSAQLPYRST